MTSSLFGSRRAKSCVFLLGTMRSLSPFATRTGWRMTDKIGRRLRTPATERFQLRQQRPDGDFFVAVLGPLLQAREKLLAGLDATWCSREEQELLWILEG